MKLLLLILTLLIDPTKIGKVNSIKSEAKEAYTKGDFKKSASLFKILSDSLGIDEEEVKMNLAHSYYQLKDTVQAQNAYQALTRSNNPAYRSIAHQQLGVLANQQRKYEQALEDFKSALKANPNNENENMKRLIILIISHNCYNNFHSYFNHSYDIPSWLSLY